MGIDDGVGVHLSKPVRHVKLPRGCVPVWLLKILVVERWLGS